MKYNLFTGVYMKKPELVLQAAPKYPLLCNSMGFTVSSVLHFLFVWAQLWPSARPSFRITLEELGKVNVEYNQACLLITFSLTLYSARLKIVCFYITRIFIAVSRNRRYWTIF